VRCTNCTSLDVDLVERRADTTRELLCLSCGHQWVHGEPRVVPVHTDPAEALRRRFPAAATVATETADRVFELKADYLRAHPEPRPEVSAFWATYQEAFSREGLPHAKPQLLKDFANSSVGANPGNMSVFNTAWNDMGPEAGAARVRASVDYLLYGPEDVPLEDRLTRLITGGDVFGMTGFRESLLTKVLCIVEPDRWLPILKYTGVAGKREIAQSVYGLTLPDPESVNWTIGRLITWSNDLLQDLLGDGFVDGPHRSAFLWQAKDAVASS
jgi:hypothetical protein